MRRLLMTVFVLACAALSGCGGGDPELVVYSGRSEPLIKPFLEEFADREGLDVRVRFADTADLVGTLLEEGDNTRADVFIGQDAPSLVRLDEEGLLQPYDAIGRTPARFRARDNTWTGLSGRARVLIVPTGGEHPDSVFDLADPRWKGKIAGPITSNVSFRDWVSAIRLVNHYYVELEKQAGSDVEAVYTDQEPGGFGVVFNVASAGITASADNVENARKLLDYLLTPEVQERFARANFEYPVLPGLEAVPGVRPLDTFRTTDVSLEELGEAADGTDELLEEVDLEG
jgi:iron(III) transport system substrate-binding protein